MSAGPLYRCKLCKDEIRSEYRHDFKWCKCGAFAIDGGSDYTKLTGNWDDFEAVTETPPLPTPSPKPAAQPKRPSRKKIPRRANAKSK